MTLKVAHVIAGLPVGGAERMLLALSEHGRSAGLESEVICLAPPGPVSHQLDDANIPVYHLGLESAWRFPFGIGALRRRLREVEPDIIQGWMYHGNLAALIAGRGLAAPIVWNIRQSLHRIDLFKMTTRLVVRANIAFSGRADSIIYNSEIACGRHEAIGFHADTAVWIPNGVDVDRYGEVDVDRVGLRKAFGISPDEFVIISVGRVHAVKGHDILMGSVRAVAKAEPRVRFLVVGEGSQWESEPFQEYVTDSLARDRVVLTGARSDIPELLSIADLFVSPSRTEGFPNAVAEAMAAGLPCVVTDVGDSAMLLGSSGEVVAAGDPESLSAGIIALVHAATADRLEMGAVARDRVRSVFSMTEMVRRYADLYRSLAS